MNGINWKRMIVGGIVSASVWGILYAPLHPLVEVHDPVGRPVLPLTPFRGASPLMRELIVIAPLAANLPIVMLAAIAGAWVYKE